MGVFVASPLATSQKIEGAPERDESHTLRECKSAIQDPTQAQIDASGKILAKAGVRLIGGVHGVDYAGVWSDLDGPEVRAAIAVFHPDGVPIRYLDGDVPMRFKLRRVPGEPVPANVLAAMKREPDEPWKVRDKMLEAMNWTPDGVPWAKYQVEQLNELFLKQGVTVQPGKIEPATVLHGERGKK